VGTERAAQGCGHGPEYRSPGNVWTPLSDPGIGFGGGPQPPSPLPIPARPPHTSAAPAAKHGTPRRPQPQRLSGPPCTTRQAPAGSEPPARRAACQHRSSTPPPSFPSPARTGDLRTLARQHADHPLAPTQGASGRSRSHLSQRPAAAPYPTAQQQHRRHDCRPPGHPFTRRGAGRGGAGPYAANPRSHGGREGAAAAHPGLALSVRARG